jgi:TPP-dependent pyruvate/acetoin dehydrogenase alpha subunit
VITRIIVPDVGATGGEVSVVAWLAKEGDFVAAGTPLFVLETDKATQEIEAFRDGFLRRILARLDTQVEFGQVVALLADSPDESLGDEPPQALRQVTQVSGDAETRRRGHTEKRYHVEVHAKNAERGVSIACRRSVTADGPLPLDLVLDLYRRMALIRRYEDHLYRLFLQGQVPGTLHQCQGQEAVAAGVCSALGPDDVIFSTHRPVGHLLAKGASLNAITAEIWGKATGCARGKGGQMHLVDVSVGAMPSNAIVGANIPIATGAALGFKLRGLDRVAVSFFGDGAANIGTFHEGINLAAVKNAPVIFVCENNLYAASTPLSTASKVPNIADRAAAYGIPGQIVDGMDVVAVYRAASAAVARAVAGDGPTLMECKTYRFPGHSRGDPGNYRAKDELEAWRRRDPIDQCRRLLSAEYQQPQARLDDIERDCQAAVELAVAFALESPEPPAEACYRHVFAEREVGG